MAIGEMSMIGRRMLKVIDDRLRQAKAKQNLFFGGISVFLCGDFGQLPPIADLPIFSLSCKGGLLSA